MGSVIVEELAAPKAAPPPAAPEAPGQRAQFQPLLRPVMPELDSIRGLAILMVIAFHAFYSQPDNIPQTFTRVQNLFIQATWVGEYGVNLFFVLSGFLITGLLLQSVRRPDYYRRFYRRRALRILPAYYAILVVLVALRASGAFLGLSAIYLSNVTPLFGVAIAYPVLWSLAVEEHFYLLWPTVVRRLRVQQLLWCAALLVLAAPVCRWISFLIVSGKGSADYSYLHYTWNAMDGLACGAFVSIGLQEFAWDRAKLFRFSMWTFAAAAAIWIVGLPFGILRAGRPLGAAFRYTPWNLGAAGILCIFLLLGTGPGKGIVLSPVLRFVGRISYGLYLVHMLAFDFYDYAVRGIFSGRGLPLAVFPALCVRFCAAGALAIGIAFLSRKYFEEPFLRWKERLG